MNEEIQKRLDDQDLALLRIFKSVEKTRKYFMWSLIATGVVFLLPLLGIIVILPKIIRTYTGILGGL